MVPIQSVEKTKEKKKALLEKLVIRYEAQSPCIKNYLQYLSWSAAQQRKLVLDWEKYYQECKDSTAGTNFYEQIAAWKRGDYATMKGHAAFAREIALSQRDEFIPKPHATIEPLHFDHCTRIGEYRSARYELKLLLLGGMETSI